jgi:prefoldin subunit 5
MADNDQALMEKALLEIWGIDRQIQEINDAAYAVVVHHTAEIRAPERLERMNDAQERFRQLLNMTRNLGEAYADNALNLANEIVTTEQIENYNIWLSYFYFMTALSKVMDVVAQFSKNPLSKVITSAKRSITDVGLDFDVARQESEKSVLQVPFAQHIGVTVTHGTNLALILANAFPETPGLPDAKWWEDLQKGLGGIIDTFKDLAALVNTRRDLNKLGSDVRQWALKSAEKFAKLLDQINKGLTLYDKVPKVAPEFVKNNAPSALKNLPTFKKETLDSIQKWLSAGKYTLEAVINFLQCCLTLGEVQDNRKTAQATLERIQQQSRSSGVAVQLGPDMFADATKKDLIEIIHHVNSSIDARDLGRAAIAGMKQTAEEIKRIARSQERHRMFGPKWQKTVDEKTVALKETAARLESYRKSLAPGMSDRTTYGSGFNRGIRWSGTKQEIVAQIDKALAKIDAFTAPYVPRWIASRSRFGPRVSPI